jgi:(p)ppGpp synthase/HD superfamily hydrolase
MPTPTALDKALALAVRAHAGQADRFGRAKILHVLGVTLRMRHDDDRLAAVLHDVVESGELTLEDLRDQGFSETVVEAVDRLTRREGEPYEACIERAGADPMARRIKMADLQDKIEGDRLLEGVPDDAPRLWRLLRALKRLKALEEEDRP